MARVKERIGNALRIIGRRINDGVVRLNVARERMLIQLRITQFQSMRDCRNKDSDGVEFGHKFKDRYRKMITSRGFRDFVTRRQQQFSNFTWEEMSQATFLLVAE